jgi:hypothetical protein
MRPMDAGIGLLAERTCGRKMLFLNTRLLALLTHPGS